MFSDFLLATSQQFVLATVELLPAGVVFGLGQTDDRFELADNGGLFDLVGNLCHPRHLEAAGSLDNDGLAEI